ncbi:MAG: hypothetical protein D6790_17680 [Caldilineae bacterium]|nr:MAG: hypothetical protein D6790_17680 [Caldilineae bacterium]
MGTRVDAVPRIECFIDVFHHTQERAQIRPDITPAELVQAIIDEFAGEISYLGRNASAYTIWLMEEERELDPGQRVDAQIRPGVRLALREREKPRPPGAHLLARPFYLREINHGYIYKVPWLPAIIGRPDPSLAENELVLVDLHDLPNGARVSRRHVRLLERDGEIFVERCARNSVTLLRAEGGEESLENHLLPLHPGDKIRLDRSQILLEALFPEPRAA